MESVDHRAIAVATFNACWDILDKPERTRDDEITLLTSAFASRLHWLEAGGPRQWVTSDWMVSRAAGIAGYPSLSIDFAQRAVDASDGQPDWMVASAAEGLARAYALAGDRERRAEWVAKATALVAAIEEDEEREIIAGQLATMPD
jgi:hypothetical protein